MSPRASARLAWSLCALSLALTVLGLLLLALNRSHPNVYVFDYWGLLTVGAISASPMGALIASRRPENPIGWISCAIGLDAGMEHFAGQYAIYALLAEPASLPGGEALAWIVAWLWVPGAGLLVFLPLLFPDGRLPSRRWRWYVWLTIAVLVAGTTSAAFLPGPIDGLGPIRNPLGVEEARDFLGPVASGSAALAEGILALVAAASLFPRLRRAGGEERQQIKWFAYAVTVVAVSFFLTYTVSEAIGIRWISWTAFGLTMISVLCIPLSIGIAILRHRLYDIDRLINRTLVYVALTGTLAAVYVGGVVLLQNLFRALAGGESNVAVVVSTLAIAALFSPLRRGIQIFIDRRLYRRRYDAAKVLQNYADRLRDETDLDRFSDALVAAVRETVQPAHASLWLRGPAFDEGSGRDD